LLTDVLDVKISWQLLTQNLQMKVNI